MFIKSQPNLMISGKQQLLRLLEPWSKGGSPFSRGAYAKDARRSMGLLINTSYEGLTEEVRTEVTKVETFESILVKWMEGFGPST